MGAFPDLMIFSAKTFTNVFNLIMYFSLFPHVWLNWYVNKLRVKLVAFYSILFLNFGKKVFLIYYVVEDML